jgi:hypothetical protein
MASSSGVTSGNKRSSSYSVKKNSEAASKVSEYFHEVGAVCPVCYHFLGFSVISICGQDCHVICVVCANKLPKPPICPICKQGRVQDWSDEQTIENIFSLLEDVRAKISNRREEKVLTFYLTTGSRKHQNAIPPHLEAAPPQQGGSSGSRHRRRRGESCQTGFCSSKNHSKHHSNKMYYSRVVFYPVCCCFFFFVAPFFFCFMSYC